MILSANAIDHALLMLAGYTAGVPVAPISVAYSLQSQDFAKLKHIAELLTPGLIYVADTAPFAKALAAIQTRCRDRREPRRRESRRDAVRRSRAHVRRARRRQSRRGDRRGHDRENPVHLRLDRPAQGRHQHPRHADREPAAARCKCWPFLAEQPLTLVDWLPWNHTFGGNHNFNMVLRHAGTLVIDGGRPLPAMVGETVRNLTEISPTIYFNVPAGYAALLPHLERDESFARSFFAQLRLIFYAGAALPQDLWERLEAVSVRTTGQRVPMSSSWGTTETAPLATAAHFLLDRAGNIGLPVPGVEIKLVPSGDKLEIRVRGPNITPGYWKRPDLTAAAFDEEGFYMPGDAVRFADESDAAQRRHVRRPARGGFQAHDRHLGACRRVARRRARGLLAGAAGRDRRGRGPRIRRAAVLAQCGRLPEADRRRCAAQRPARARAASSGARARAQRLAQMERGASGIVGARSRACCCCPMRPRSTPTRSPTRATSTSASRWSGAQPMWRACSPRSRIKA